MKTLEELIAAFEEKAAEVSFSGGNRYGGAFRYAERLGKIMGDLLNGEFKGLELTSEQVQGIIKPFMLNGYSKAVDAAATVQGNINTAAKVSIKVAKPNVKRVDRIDNLAAKMIEEGQKADFLLDRDVCANICRAGVTDTINDNFTLQRDAGLSTTIKRISDSGCCDWCDSVSGTFTSKDQLPDGFWSFHKDCSCYIDYQVSKYKTDRISMYTDKYGNRHKVTA